VEYKRRFPILGNALPHLGSCPHVTFNGAQHVISPLSTANAVRPLSFDHRIANHPNFLKHTHVLSFSYSCPIIPPHRFPPLDIMPPPIPLLDPAEHPLQPLLISGSSIGSTSKFPKPSAGLTPEVSALLPHFASPGIPPPSARVDPTLKIGHPGPPIRLWDIWKYGWLAAGKGAPVRTVRAPVIYPSRMPLISLFARARIGCGRAFASYLRSAKEIMGN